MKMKTLGGLLAATMAGTGMAASSNACVMPLPEPSPGNEYEIEQEFEGYDSSSDRVRYKIEIEVELFSPDITAQCQCAVSLGSSSILAPSSFEVTGAIVGLRGGSEVDIEEFDGFSRDNAVESEFAGLPEFQDGATPFGFSVDVTPFDVPAPSQGDLLALIFEIQFDPDDFDQVNGNTIMFAAGSSDPTHSLSVFDGYQITLDLPRVVIPEPASVAMFGGLGLVGLARRSRNRS